MKRVDFMAVAREHAKTALSRKQVEANMREDAAVSRAQHLEQSGIRGAITAEDWAVLTRGKPERKTDALEAVQRWYRQRTTLKLRRPVTMQVLVGESGVGKTFAAAWLLAELGGTYVTAEDVRKLYVSNFDAAHARFKHLMVQTVLCVDDLGTERSADDAKGMMFEIVNARMGLGAGWTMFTANMAEAQFRDRNDVRVLRRIEHQGAIVTVGGNDLRRR